MTGGSRFTRVVRGPWALAIGALIGIAAGLVWPALGPLAAPGGRAFVDALRLMAPATLLTIVPVSLASLHWENAGSVLWPAASRAAMIGAVAALAGTLIGMLATLPPAPTPLVVRPPWHVLTRSLDDLTLVALVAVPGLTLVLRRASVRQVPGRWPRLMARAADLVRRGLDVLLAIAPLGVAALAAGLAASAPGAMVSTLAVVGGLVWASQGVAAVAVLAWARRVVDPSRPVLRSARDALVTAFVTGSSAATLPVEWTTAVERLGVSPRIAGLVIPIGSVVSKCGTTAFLAVLAMAALRWSGVPLDAGSALRCTAGAMILGALTPPINGGGLVMLGVLASRLGADPGLAPVLVAIPFVGKLNTPGNVLGRLAIAASLAPRDRHPTGASVGGG